MKQKRELINAVRELSHVQVYILVRALKCFSRREATDVVLSNDVLRSTENAFSEYGDSYVHAITTGTEYIAILPVQLFSTGDERTRLLGILKKLPETYSHSRDRQNILESWTALINCPSTCVQFYQVQTQITDSDVHLGTDLSLPNILDYAGKTVLQEHNWPSILEVNIRGYERLVNADKYFPRLQALRSLLLGTESGPGLYFWRVNLVAQLSAIHSIQQIYKYWDPQWMDDDLQSALSEISAEYRLMNDLMNRLRKILTKPAHGDQLDLTDVPPLNVARLSKRPRLRVKFFVDISADRLYAAKWKKIVYTCNGLDALAFSGTAGLNGIHLHYRDDGNTYQYRTHGIRPSNDILANIGALQIRSEDSIVYIESYTIRTEEKLGRLRHRLAPSKPATHIAYIRMATAQNHVIEFGHRASAPQRQHKIVQYGSGRFIVRFEIRFEEVTSSISSIEPILAQFSRAEWN